MQGDRLLPASLVFATAPRYLIAGRAPIYRPLPASPEGDGSVPGGICASSPTCTRGPFVCLCRGTQEFCGALQGRAPRRTLAPAESERQQRCHDACGSVLRGSAGLGRWRTGRWADATGGAGWLQRKLAVARLGYACHFRTERGREKLEKLGIKGSEPLNSDQGL